MKVLLINPMRSYSDEYFPISKGNDVSLPLALLYIAAVIEKRCDVEILDTQLHEDTRLVATNGEMEYGVPWLRLKEIIKQKQPDIVGVTNQFSAQIKNAVKTADIVKEVNTKTVTIIGGNHVSVRAMEFLKENKSLDIAVIGEGELVMLDIVKHFQGRSAIEDIKGIAFRKNDKVFLNERRGFLKNIDELPWPAYHLVDMEKYLSLHEKCIYARTRDEQRVISVITSRGCPFNCVFCSIHATVGRAWRPHSAEYVVNLIRHVVDKYDVREIHFEDDNFTLDIQRCEKILDGITGLGVKWDTPNGVRADIFSRSLFTKMKASGCKSLSIGIESGSQRVLDEVIEKRLDLKKAEEFARLCKEFRIPLNAFYVIGIPGETKEDIKKTIDFALMLQKKYGVMQGGAALAEPIYGTRLYDICERNGYFVKKVTPEALAEGKGLIKTEEFTPEELERFNQKLIRANYLRYLRHPLKQREALLKNPKLLINVAKKFIGS